MYSAGSNNGGPLMTSDTTNRPTPTLVGLSLSVSVSFLSAGECVFFFLYWSELHHRSHTLVIASQLPAASTTPGDRVPFTHQLFFKKNMWWRCNEQFFQGKIHRWGIFRLLSFLLQINIRKRPTWNHLSKIHFVVISQSIVIKLFIFPQSSLFNIPLKF